MVAPGCSRDGDVAEPATATAPADETTTPAAESEAPEAAEAQAPSGEADAAQTVRVNLLSPGAEPREVLRYSLEKGHKEKVAMTMTMGMEMEMAGMPSQPIKMPPMKMTMELAITELLGDDAARYAFSVTDSDVLKAEGVEPMVAQALQAEIEKIVGMKGTARVDSRGFNSDATLEVPEDLPPQMAQIMESTQQSMDQMSSPMPAEARWAWERPGSSSKPSSKTAYAWIKRVSSSSSSSRDGAASSRSPSPRALPNRLPRCRGE